MTLDTDVREAPECARITIERWDSERNKSTIDGWVPNRKMEASYIISHNELAMRAEAGIMDMMISDLASKIKAELNREIGKEQGKRLRSLEWQ